VAPRLSDYRGQLEPAYPDCFMRIPAIVNSDSTRW
jgi:hypothetical protein